MVVFLTDRHHYPRALATDSSAVHYGCKWIMDVPTTQGVVGLYFRATSYEGWLNVSYRSIDGQGL